MTAPIPSPLDGATFLELLAPQRYIVETARAKDEVSATAGPTGTAGVSQGTRTAATAAMTEINRLVLARAATLNAGGS